MKRTARGIGSTGLLAVGALHGVWASGSSWPAKNSKQLAQAVVGDSKGMPEPNVSAGIAAAAVSSGLIAGGAFGEGRLVVALRRLMGLGLIASAVVSDETVLEAIGYSPKGKRSKELNQRYYRPVLAVLGVAVLLGARQGKRVRVESAEPRED